MSSTPPPTPDRREPRHIAATASMHSFLGYAATMALRLGGQLLLAKLLYPAAFGVMTLVATFQAGLEMLSDIGLGPSVIQKRKEDDPVFLNTVWTLQIVRGALLTLLAVLLAWPYASYYSRETEAQSELLAWCIVVSSMSALISGFGSTKLFTVNRDLRVDLMFRVRLISQALGLIVMASWACLYPSVWALACGGLVASLTTTVISHRFLPGVRNRLHLDRAHVREVLHFGTWVFLSSLLAYVTQYADRLIFGKILTDSAELGVYGLGRELAFTHALAIGTAMGVVLFPLFSRLRHEQADISEVARKLRAPYLTAAAMCTTALLTAGDLIPRVLFDDRYHAAGNYIPFVAAGSWFFVLEAANSAYLLSGGHAATIACCCLAKLVGIGVFVPLGHEHYGVSGALVGLVLSDSIKYSVSMLFARKFGLRSLRLDLQLTGVILASLLPTILLRSTFPELNEWARGGLGCGLGLFCWVPHARALLRRLAALRTPASA